MVLLHPVLHLFFAFDYATIVQRKTNPHAKLVHEISVQMLEFDEKRQIFIWFLRQIWKIASEYSGANDEALQRWMMQKGS